MTPPQVGVVLYWLAIAAFTVAYDVWAVRTYGWEATISFVMERACQAYPLLAALVVLACVALAYHLVFGCWPFRGE